MCGFFNDAVNLIISVQNRDILRLFRAEFIL
jgi:hypothetical protein